MRIRIMIATMFSIVLGFGITARTQVAGVQQRAWSYILQARQGDGTAAEKAVAMLEEAVTASPQDRALLDLLGRSYFIRLSTQSRAAAAPDQLIATVQKAAGVFKRVLDLNPDDPDALSGHGMALTIMAAFQVSREMVAQGIEEMNRAIKLAPEKTHLRLTRGFTMISMPPPIRNTSTVIEDLNALIPVATRSNPRAADVLHIMLGDIYFETGQKDRAKDEYKAVSEKAREQARSRTSALDEGVIPTADISSFRSGLGSKCTMCHGE